jgi:hypothetical protein
VTLLDKATRRRIGALQRRAHAFHRYAHHPLCGAYAREVFQVGKKTRLCKGCLMTAGGVLFGGALGLAATYRPGTFSSALTNAPGTFLEVLAVSAALLLFLTRRRLPKLLTRAIPAFLLSSVAARMFLVHSWIGLGVGVALAAGSFVLYRRRGPERSPCVTCPERSTTKVCSGFSPIDRAERAFVRVSHRLIDERVLAEPRNCAPAP